MRSEEATTGGLLTEEEAINISIELWTWLAETGYVGKSNWPGWRQHGRMANECAMCEYSIYHELEATGGHHGACDRCPYNRVFGICTKTSNPFWRWTQAFTDVGRAEAARDILQQLKQLKEAL